jgi:hypothetical protein
MTGMKFSLSHGPSHGNAHNCTATPASPACTVDPLHVLGSQREVPDQLVPAHLQDVSEHAFDQGEAGHVSHGLVTPGAPPGRPDLVRSSGTAEDNRGGRPQQSIQVLRFTT